MTDDELDNICAAETQWFVDLANELEKPLRQSVFYIDSNCLIQEINDLLEES